ncbi:MAG: hypothetical protein Q7S81_00650 [bacterium]|nr:hypothetical protein [bacterium]
MSRKMYSVYFEIQSHSMEDRPIGRIIQLPDPDMFPAESDDEAVKEACRLAEVNERLRSHRLTRGGGSKKILLRVRMIKKELEGRIIFAPRYKNGSFNETQNSKVEIA